jgi:general secretion pathway protein B
VQPAVERPLAKVARVAVAAPVSAPPSAAAPVATVLKAPTAAASAPSSAAASAPSAATDRILAVAELPPDVQRDLPKLAISGGVHSDNAAQRMLIVGGQVMHEGAEVAPGLVLEQIRPRNAVLRFRGLRYSVGY